MRVTTGKLCIGQLFPPGGLRRSMFHPTNSLRARDIYLAPGNKDDEIHRQTQRYWIAEAIRYVHREAVEAVFSEPSSDSASPLKQGMHLVGWPEFPKVERLSPRKTVHHSLDPILGNKGSVTDTYWAIDVIFKKQLCYDDFEQHLQLIYGNQTTVTLIRRVQKERDDASLFYDRYDWLLAIPGLFHWRTHYMDMLHEVYSGSNHGTVFTTLFQNEASLGCVQGPKSLFHHKEEIAMQAFDARVTAAYYQHLPSGISPTEKGKVDCYIKRSGRKGFLDIVEKIRSSLFSAREQSQPDAKSPQLAEFDFEFSAHAKFLQQMEVYKTLTHAIKFADIGLIRRLLARCALLFHGYRKAKKTKYAFLSLYMTWLTQTSAADVELQNAILANGLVNLRGAEDSWFEVDRLNESFNLQMKTLMAPWRTNTVDDVASLFERTALTAGYCTDLKASMDDAFGDCTDNKDQPEDDDASEDVRSLSLVISDSGSIKKSPSGRSSTFKPTDILTRGVLRLANGVDRFNELVAQGGWDEEELGDLESASITVIDDFVAQDGDMEI